ncbi:hypothetical protein Mal64_00990 [Pseudobythopirellula maris]|uniref:Nitroreductase family protein n=1 Tax=Pseudobythopirellula maris TaxID=2527991 RepID=A0A5C5ZR13_9BACT|nr:hypothetical protein [Pseudobythopirellula maris]TWT89720.1 hypothetical protein Mal64_00990 [Pseudobythopirellula maris]
MTVACEPIGSTVLRDIVAAATRAPSAENTQPWRLQWIGDRLRVLHDRSRAMSSDIDSMLDLTGIGTLIESLVIAASSHGLQAEVEALEGLASYGQLRPVTDLLFEACSDTPDPLTDTLESRCTTRRMDANRPLTPEQQQALLDAAEAFPQVRIDWVEDEDLRAVARLVGVGNRVRFEHQPFHAEIYENLRFTAEEALCTSDGLDVATLQLPLGAAGLMRVLRSWPLARIANSLGFSRGVARQASQEVLTSSGVALLSVDAANPECFVEGGRALQRVWLEATRLGLAFHPMASLPVFVAHAKRSCHSTLPPRQRGLITRMLDELHEQFPSLGDRTLQMSFRVGHGVPPARRTLRYSTEQVLQTAPTNEGVFG